MFSIAAFVTRIIEILRDAVANHIVAQQTPPQVTWLGDRAYTPIVPPARHPPIPTETWLLLRARLNRLAQRFQSLFDKWQAGTLQPTRPRSAPPAKPADAPPRPASPYIRLPRQRGWITLRVPAAAVAGGLFYSLINRPDMPGFIADVPRAGRLIRPICHALGVNLYPWLRLPPRRRHARKPKPPRARPAPLDPPLQPYVRAAARAWKPRYG